MRKLLLATVAALGVTTGYGAAYAQQADDSGQSTTSAFGGAVVGNTVQAPGTLVVRLNGRVYGQGGILSAGNANGSYYYNPVSTTISELPFINGVGTATVGGAPVALPQFFGSAAQATALGYRPATTAAGAQNVIVQAGQPQSSKLNNYGVYSYFRLYPGFDGVAANGLLYGAGVEIRQDGNWPAGLGQDGGISAATSRQGLLYVRRAWGYVGSGKFGIVRFGTTDGPSDLFMVGNNENFGDGGWNGSAAAYLPGQLWLYWPFADSGQLYAANKVVYLSPAFAGFDFGAAFAPTTTGTTGAQANQGCNAPGGGVPGQSATSSSFLSGTAVAGAGCSQLSSTNTLDYTRWRNMYDLAVRYRGLFGPVGFAAYADYTGSGTISDHYPVAHRQVDGYSVGSGGAQVTFGGLTIGGMAQGGRFNYNSWTLAPKGGSDGVAVEFGGSYTYGPFVVGAHLYRLWAAGESGPLANPDGSSTGRPSSVGQIRETGIAAGATYSVAPGLAVNLTYIWGERFENGRDFLTNEIAYPVSPVNNLGCGPSGSAGTTAACLHNKTTASGIMLGAQLTW